MIKHIISDIHKKSIKVILKIIKHGHLYLAYLIFKKDILYSNVFKKQLLKFKLWVAISRFFEKKYQKALIKEYNLSVPNTLTHSKTKIWFCWLQGLPNAPRLVEVCLASLRLHNPNNEIIVITEENLSNYIQIPNFIIEKRKKGIIKHAHFADIIRVELLVKYGGIWTDAYILHTAPIPNTIKNTDFFMFTKWTNKLRNSPNIASNWFIRAEKQHVLLVKLQDFLHLYWKEYNVPLCYHFFHIYFTLLAKYHSKEWEETPVISNTPYEILSNLLHKPFNKKQWEVITENAFLHKLSGNRNQQTKDTYYDFVANTYYSNIRSIVE